MVETAAVPGSAPVHEKVSFELALDRIWLAGLKPNVKLTSLAVPPKSWPRLCSREAPSPERRHHPVRILSQSRWTQPVEHPEVLPIASGRSD